MWSKIKSIGFKLFSVSKSGVNWVLRHGPVIASLVVGLGVIPGLAPYLKWIGLLLGSTGTQPSPELSEPLAAVITQIVLLVGAIRKLYSNFRKYQAKNQ